MGITARNRLHRRDRVARRRSNATPTGNPLERLEPRIALAADTIARPILEAATTLYIDAVNSPEPILFGRSDLVGNDANSFVVTSVASGVVEKWIPESNTWRDVSTTPTSSNPHELLALLANRVFHTGDQLRWIPPAGTSATPQKALGIVGWDDGSNLPLPDPSAVPGEIQNLTITQTGITELTLSWDAVATATHFTIGVETVVVSSDLTGDVFVATSASYVTKGNAFVLSDLDPNAFRSFRVTAINRAGAGPSTLIDASMLLWTNPQEPGLGFVDDSSPPETTPGPLQTLPANVWFQFDSVLTNPAGNNSLQLPDTGADGAFAGSVNGLAFRPTPDGGLLYAGASNGGVYARTYTTASDSWSDSWTWVSKPGSGYGGSQSIAQLAISPDGQLLAVGQGASSNFGGVGVKGNGIQVGRIQSDGSIAWLPGVSELLHATNIRSLEWTSNSHLLATSFDVAASPRGVVMFADVDPTQGLIAESVRVMNRAGLNTILAQGPNDAVVAVGHDLATFQNFIGTMDEFGEFTPLRGLEAYLEATSDVQLARVAIYPRLVDEPGFSTPQLIVFVGSFDRTASMGRIAQIDRLVVDPETLTIQSFANQDVAGHVGDNQASNDSHYGNFSLAVDPSDLTARAVFTGGNTGYPNAGPVEFAGGLVHVTVGDPNPFVGFYSQLDDTQSLAPGAPHPDSRTILFIDTPAGLSLLESSDGGVWQLTFGDDRSPETSRWHTLAALGMNTLETMAADYNSVLNAIAGSYQDNGSSVGEVGDAQTSIFGGDGQFVIFDDGLVDDDGITSLYLSPQQYLLYGQVLRFDFQDGDLTSAAEMELKLLTDTGGLEDLTEPGSAAFFKKPIEGNAYRTGSILMAGTRNLYEQAGTFSDTDLVFRPLLDTLPDSAMYKITAIDNQGSPFVELDRYDSLYVAYQSPIGYDTRIDFREPGQSSPELNPTPLYSVAEELATTATPPDYLLEPNINDIAHRPAAGASDGDIVYWLQGGSSVAYLGATNSPSQVIRYKQAGSFSNPITLVLEDIGIQLDEIDQYKLQSIVYVPETEAHGEQLIVGALHGMWIADLDDAGNPGPFTKMHWDGLPDEGPGSYHVAMKYDPVDDVLVAAQLGHGIWLYSFTGSLGTRVTSEKAVTASDLILPQTADPLLTKRKQERNAILEVDLHRDLFGDAPTIVYVDLYDFSAWQDNLELVSLESPSIERGKPEDNLLTEAGQIHADAELLADGTLRIPLTFESHQTTHSLVINAREFATPAPTFALHYSVTIADTDFTDDGQVVLESGSPASSLLWESAGDLADPWSPAFDSMSAGPAREIIGNHAWIRPSTAGGIATYPSQAPASDDVIYVGAAMSLAMGYAGDDLFIVDANTWGTNWLVGGDGCDEFRLVAIEGDFPAFPQIIVDFEPGKDRISLPGLSMRDLAFEAMGNGTLLRAKGHAIASVAGVSPRVLQDQNNISFG